MPTTLNDDAVPVVQFDPELEVSPFLVFRKLSEGRRLVLVDVRERPGAQTLRGARRLSEDFLLPEGEVTVLFDEDGSRAVAIADELRRRGHDRVKALFGGLDLWRFSLDPEVIGQDTFLEETETLEPGSAAEGPTEPPTSSTEDR